MKEITFKNRDRNHSLIKVIGIMTLTLLVFVSVTGAAPFAYVVDRWNGPVVDGIAVVDVIDTATNTITAYVPGNPEEGPGVAVNPAGTKVYVTNSGKNTVSVIDTATNKVTATVTVGSSPYGVAVTLDGKKVYVTNNGDSTVSVIDTATNKVTATVTVGSSPYGVAVNPAGTKVYVTNSGKNTVSVIDTATNKVTATVTVGSSPYGVAVTPNGKKVYVPCSSTTPYFSDGSRGLVSVIDTATNTVTANVKDGFGNTGGVAVTPDGKKVYVVTSGQTGAGYGLFVINTATDTGTGAVGYGAPIQAFGQFIGPSVTPTPQKPVAAFTASPTSGFIPLKVQFTDKSTNNPTSWKWDFGDGTTSTTHNPLHTYIKAGSLTVTLTATNAAGSSKVIKTAYIILTTPKKPIASFSASPTSGKAPLTVKFTDKSTNSPTSWSWKFGDGTSASSQNPTHKYAKKGTYSVSLTVKNAGGSSSIAKSKFITIK